MSKGTYKTMNCLATAKYQHILLEKHYTEKNGNFNFRKKVFSQIINSTRRWKKLEGAIQM